MSLYCLGTICPKADDCLRVKAYNELIAEHPEIDKMSIPDCASLGIWFVTQAECIKHGYDDGVFPKKGGQQ